MKKSISFEFCKRALDNPFVYTKAIGLSISDYYLIVRGLERYCKDCKKHDRDDVVEEIVKLLKKLDTLSDFHVLTI